MSPGEFNRAWDARNERLKAAGVYEHLDELAERFGWNELHQLKPSTLVEAAQQLRAKRQ